MLFDVQLYTAIWSNLPADIRSANSLRDFKRSLKTRIFTVAFNTELYSSL